MVGITADPDPRRDADRQVIARFQAGTDREGAIGELFRSYGPMTYAFFRRRIGDPEVAAELNQELFMAVVRALDRFRGDSSFRTWLFRMAHNELSNLRRRWRVHLDERAADPPEGLIESLASFDEADPARTLEREETARGLLRCLAELSETERAVIHGQFYEGVTLAELTTRLGLTNASGARATLIAAQRALRRCLERTGRGRR